MATPTPLEQIADDLKALQTKIGWLQESVRLNSTRDAIEDLQTKVNGLPQRIGNLRTQGYVFDKDLEERAKTFIASWAKLQPSLTSQVNSQSNLLIAALRPIETQLPQLVSASSNPAAARPLLTSIQSAVDSLEDKVSATEKSINGMYDEFDRQVYELTKLLVDIEFLLTQIAEASFQLIPTESGLAAVKAVWCKQVKEQKGDPEGILFLTDQRIIFEQKEEMVTKKVLFIATEKQKVQQLQWDVPVQLVEKVETSKQGLLKNEDHIEIRFASGAPREFVHLHIWQDCAYWQGLINRAKIKDFDKTRAVAVDQSAVDKVKAAPSQCPSCGANINAVVLRGMDTIKCEYCGFVIRL
jgi:hypothetical protein